MNVTLVVAVESPLPPDSGTRQRNLHLARRLAAELPVEMAVLGPAVGTSGEPFELMGVGHQRSRLGSLLAGVTRPYSAAKLHSAPLQRLVRERKPAVVQAAEIWLVPAALAAGCPVVLDAHNVEAALLRSLAAADHRVAHRVRWRWEARKTAGWERRRALEVAAVCATSEADAEAFERYGAADVVIVPNGVDTGAVAHALPAAGGGLLYVGHYGYAPNVAAALELAREVLPRVRAAHPEASARIVGRDPTPALLAGAGRDVEVTGAVDDVLEHLRWARAVVVPLRSGSGTRLKVLEALAAGVPVVSTPKGVEGLPLRDGRDVLLGRTPAELALQAGRVIADDALARRLSLAGRELVERTYDWATVARPLIELHHRLRAVRRP